MIWTILYIAAFLVLLGTMVLLMACVLSARKSAKTGMPWDGIAERVERRR